MRPIVFLTAVFLAFCPRLALAWSEYSSPKGQSSSAFTDPDQKVQNLTGRDEYGNTTNNSSRSESGITFFGPSANTAPSSAPLAPLFAPSWVSPRH